MKFAPGKPKTGGRRAGQRNKRTIEAAIAKTDALKYLSDLIDSDDQTIGRDLKVKAAICLASYQHPKPAPVASETFIGLDGYAAPQSPQEARELILTLGERMARREVSVEAHDALVGGLKVYLGDAAMALEEQVAALEDLVHYGPPAERVGNA